MLACYRRCANRTVCSAQPLTWWQSTRRVMRTRGRHRLPTVICLMWTWPPRRKSHRRRQTISITMSSALERACVWVRTNAVVYLVSSMNQLFRLLLPRRMWSVQMCAWCGPVNWEKNSSCRIVLMFSPVRYKCAQTGGVHGDPRTLRHGTECSTARHACTVPTRLTR
jgi:hypothetical protein